MSYSGYSGSLGYNRFRNSSNQKCCCPPKGDRNQEQVEKVTQVHLELLVKLGLQDHQVLLVQRVQKVIQVQRVQKVIQDQQGQAVN